ncbi:MAG: hypothetical protein CEN90_78 [Parcubacteria group bacterium Licking1014_17]|nr:MAG: hypothetical protein CEN90_78 [Parcubacteria group bacterium Licking1014_17]
MVTGIIVFLIDLVVGIIEVLLALRFLLRLFGASGVAAFVAWIYRVSQVFREPFAGILPDIHLTQRLVLELSSLVAIIIYGIIGYLVIRFLHKM